MKRNLFLSAGLLLGAILVAACGSQAPADSSHDGPATDYVNLIDALRAKGATIEPNGDVSQPFFTIEGQVIQVNGQDVQVFEYPDEAAADADAALVAPGGSSVGTTMVSWVAPPHFYHAGRLILLYVGDDATTIDLLDTVLGSQFAGA
jgi:hypothetical protein